MPNTFRMPDCLWHSWDFAHKPGLYKCERCGLYEQRCGYCNNANEEDVRLVMLRTRPGGPWDGYVTSAGKSCRKYLRGHFKYIKEEVKSE